MDFASHLAFGSAAMIWNLFSLEGHDDVRPWNDPKSQTIVGSFFWPVEKLKSLSKWDLLLLVEIAHIYFLFLEKSHTFWGVDYKALTLQGKNPSNRYFSNFY